MNRVNVNNWVSCMMSIKNLKRVPKRICSNLFDAEIQLLAPSMAFMTILSLVPFLAISLFTFQFFGGPENFIAFLEPKVLDFVRIDGLKFNLGQWQPFLEKFLTENLTQKLIVFLGDILKNIDAQSIGLTGFISLLLTSTKLLSDVDRAIQRIWRVKLRRSIFKRFPVYFLIIIFGPIFLSVVLGFLSSGAFGILEKAPPSFLKKLTFFSLSLFLFVIYKTVPHKKTYVGRSLVAAAVGTLGLYLTHLCYFLIMKNLLFYNKVYGSLASVPLFLVWILLVWTVVLSGAVFNATLHEDS